MIIISINHRWNVCFAYFTSLGYPRTVRYCLCYCKLLYIYRNEVNGTNGTRVSSKILWILRILKCCRFPFHHSLKCLLRTFFNSRLKDRQLVFISSKFIFIGLSLISSFKARMAAQLLFEVVPIDVLESFFSYNETSGKYLWQSS